MAITYHAGNRIQGTQADFDGSPAISGGWKELDRVTVGAGQTSVNLDVTSLNYKRYYMILHNHITDGTSMRVGIKFNGDDATPYSYAETRNQGSNPRADDNTNTGGSELNVTNALNTAEDWFGVAYLANKADRNKLYLSNYVGQNATGVTNAPNRVVLSGKWTKGTDAVNQITASRITGSGVADSGSELIVLGYDPDDTHTDNFWTLLKDTSGSGTSFNTGTFTAKKYLWIQVFYKATGGGLNASLRVGNNTISTSNYAYSTSQNGANEDTTTSGQGQIVLDSGTTDSGEIGFANIFVVNNANKEKLFNINQVSQIGAISTAPNRRETVAKWVDNNQINIVGLHDAGTGGNFTSSSFIKVWGSD